MDEELLFYDTETTGFPLCKKPSDHEDQPHLVQLAAIVVNAKTREVTQSIDLIIKPDGWEIPKKVVKIHGITTQHAMSVGMEEDFAVLSLIALWNVRKRIAYNESFDAHIIKIAIMRTNCSRVRQRWINSESECSMWLAKKAMGLSKKPSLSKAYEYYTGNKLENAHSAMSDTLACKDVYFGALDEMEENKLKVESI